MCIYERRLQILLDDARYRRVAAEARARKTSVAAVIRDAIDRALPVDLDAKRRAADELAPVIMIDPPAYRLMYVVEPLPLRDTCPRIDFAIAGEASRTRSNFSLRNSERFSAVGSIRKTSSGSSHAV